MAEAPVYLDHAATTPVRPEVREAMLPYLDLVFGNPSSAHRFGRAARAGLEQARREVAESLGADPAHVFFTSGGTEADNLAVIGAAEAARQQGRPRRVVVSAVEHKAVLAAAHHVAATGGSERLLPVDAGGRVELDALDAALAEHAAVVSVMWVNNETGVVQPVEDVAARCQAAGVPYHTDAIQAVGKVPCGVRDLGITFLTISGHKIGAPKGIGAIVVRTPTLVEPLVHGGGQQRGLRPGTENVPGAVALGRAVALAVAEQADFARRAAGLRDELAARLRAAVPDLLIAGEQAPRAPHVLTVLVPGADSEALLMHLDLAGVACSSGSACTTGSVEPSHVLTAMGVPRDLALGAVRFSLGRTTTASDVERAAAVFPRVVEKVRRLAGVLGRA
ncbi:MAG TPA: cysteine desulfurase family protein [Gemmatimonadales bacterium]|jgi:cysteine desulfurase|nr:cysteine desulfurase family protein [Gemmatimonadales bacterium]